MNTARRQEPGGPGAWWARSLVGRRPGGPRADVCGRRRLSGDGHTLEDTEVDRAALRRRGVRHVRIAHAAHAWMRAHAASTHGTWHTLRMPGARTGGRPLRRRGGLRRETSLARRPHTSGQAAECAAAMLGELCPLGRHRARPWAAAAAGGGDRGGRGRCSQPQPQLQPQLQPQPQPQSCQQSAQAARAARETVDQVRQEEHRDALGSSLQSTGARRWERCGAEVWRRGAEVLRCCGAVVLWLRLRLRLWLRRCGAVVRRRRVQERRPAYSR